MALSPKISICTKDNCKQLVLSDTTGLYSVTNTGGWGSPNIELDEAVEALASVTIPDNDTPLEVDVTTEVNNATIVDGTFILTTLTMEDDFDSDEDTPFPDGIYEVTYTITAPDSTVYTYSIKTFSTCNAACCLEKMKTKFEEKMCGCEWDDFMKNYYLAKAILSGAKRAFACGDNTKAENLLEQVQKICKNSKCNC